jgi:pimeloyl-ACP methyl ester carboxylesterase
MPALAALLAKHFTVFTYDRRGRNQSTDTAPYAVEREVEDLAALIDQASGPAFVYGISSGGALAIQAAARGLAIQKLALYEIPYVVDGGAPPPVDAAAQLTALAASGRRGDAVEFYMVQVMGMPVEAVTGLRSSPAWPALEAVAYTLAYDATIMGDWSLPAKQAASITLPVLVMDGEQSFPVLRQAAQVLAHALPAAQQRTLPGQAHDVSAEALAPLLVDFFTAG